ncbi:MAG TPA: amidohydrolase family protein, partial [Saprospiraceae bacterium]|nr:amidohydrolase family protein [Saprospiraceae bacterium]
MRKITADWVCPVSSEPLPEAVVILDDAGRIQAIEPRHQHDPASLDSYTGILIPGFVNAHCHLELSHMKGLVDSGTGLIPFITGVVTRRDAAAEIIAESIRQAEEEMLRGGIVAVGDISNTADTFAAKAAGRLRYHTFVEMFDFLQDREADKTMGKGLEVYERLALAPGSAKSLAPHAPYSVSGRLFQRIRDFHAAGQAVTVSIHNQETPPENELFERGTGGFVEFYGRFGISLEQFQATGQGSIFYAMRHLDPACRTLFVHNTLSTQAEIEAAQRWSSRVYWASCPNANLYIENRLPDYRRFLETGARVALGTDSLTSNWQLSILEEMKTIARYQRYVPFADMLRWATLHGAEALGFEKTLGSLEPGKQPGLLLLRGVDISTPP